MNFKISSKKYHRLTKQNVRDAKAARWTKNFREFEENDRNNYDRMPSPKGDDYLDYIHHRLTVMKRGMAVYTTEKYTRLNFDKYIESNRVCDRIAAMLASISFLNESIWIMIFEWKKIYVFLIIFTDKREAMHYFHGSCKTSTKFPHKNKEAYKMSW